MPRLPLPAAQCLSLDALGQRERRARFSVSLGCPSFGGQRTGNGHSSRLLASLVTDLTPSLSGKRAVGLLRFPSSVVLCENLCTASLAALGRRVRAFSSSLAQPQERQMPEVSTHRRRASGPSSQSSSAVAVSRSGHLLVQPGSPNRSVKGTSRKRAAPYVER
jgi:hypothetical protein